jgi:hypothetical protein
VATGWSASAIRCLVGVATLGILGGGLPIGCASNPGDDTAEVTFALALPDGVSITSVNWRVLSPGVATPVAAGTINTVNAGATASLNLTLPQGSGYTLTMTTTTTDGVPCSGTSAPFNVALGTEVMPVSVTLACGNVTPASGTGQIVVSGTLVAGDSCPVLASSLLSIDATVADGGTGMVVVLVSVLATDADGGDLVSYTWTATAGSLASPGAATTQYTCTTSGPQTLSVAISDNHAPTSCAVNVTFPAITCP